MQAAEPHLRAASASLALWASAWRSRAELLTSAAIVAAWASLTWGVVGFFPSVAAPIWRVSVGLLLLSLAGWKFVGFVARTGLYTLTRGKDA